MTRVHRPVVALFALLASPMLTGCRNDTLGPDQSAAAESSESDTASDTSNSEGESETGDEPEPLVLVNHDFGEITLAPFQELSNCVQWTVDNDEAVYVQGVTLSNYGYFHHSNWFVVPEDMYEGPDGFFSCASRDFAEIEAAASGTVLFAQSTQSFLEVQRTRDGAVVKIPPRHKIVAGTHMLNVGPAEISTRLYMSLEITHPRDVDVVLTPFRLSYLDLDIPALSESRFTGICDDFGQRIADATGKPIDIELHYALAHYHYLGNYFDLSFTGGPLDGQSGYHLEGFNGDANGKVYDPPLDLTGVQGLRYTCGYDNWRDVNVGWGIGDQEMCVMLGLADLPVMFDASVTGGSIAVGTNDEGVLEFEGPCGLLVVAKNPSQAPPTAEEIAADMYVPPSGDDTLPPVPECVDHDPSVAPVLEPTLTNVVAVVFQQSCTFNACHGASSQAAGLNLQAPTLLAELLDHEVLGNVGATLVEPGDLENSWLYQIMAKCEPGGGSGNHMPLNAPVLLGDGSVALVRDWILAGALDN
jgi:hypothetical protein